MPVKKERKLKFIQHTIGQEITKERSKETSDAGLRGGFP